jgi:hypothetical protein
MATKFRDKFDAIFVFQFNYSNMAAVILAERRADVTFQDIYIKIINILLKLNTGSSY